MGSSPSNNNDTTQKEINKPVQKNNKQADPKNKTTESSRSAGGVRQAQSQAPAAADSGRSGGKAKATSAPGSASASGTTKKVSSNGAVNTTNRTESEQKQQSSSTRSNSQMASSSKGAASSSRNQAGQFPNIESNSIYRIEIFRFHYFAIFLSTIAISSITRVIQDKAKCTNQIFIGRKIWNLVFFKFNFLLTLFIAKNFKASLQNDCSGITVKALNWKKI